MVWGLEQTNSLPVILSTGNLLSGCPSSKMQPVRMGTRQSRGDTAVRAAKPVELAMEVTLNDHRAMLSL